MIGGSTGRGGSKTSDPVQGAPCRGRATLAAWGCEKWPVMVSTAECRERAEARRRSAGRAAREQDKAERLRLADEWLKRGEQIARRRRKAGNMQAAE